MSSSYFSQAFSDNVIARKIVSVSEHRKYQNHPGRPCTEPAFVCNWVCSTNDNWSWDKLNKHMRHSKESDMGKWKVVAILQKFFSSFYWSENSTQCNLPEISSVRNTVPQTLKWNQGTEQPQQTQFLSKKTDSLLAWQAGCMIGLPRLQAKLKSKLSSSFLQIFFFKSRIILLCTAAIFKQKPKKNFFNEWCNTQFHLFFKCS